MKGYFISDVCGKRIEFTIDSCEQKVKVSQPGNGTGSLDICLLNMEQVVALRDLTYQLESDLENLN